MDADSPVIAGGVAVPSAAMETALETMAALSRNAADKFGDAVATRSKVDGEWVERTYVELWAAVQGVARGLIGLGVEAGDRVAILADAGVDFTVADLAISTVGAIVVPVYPTNSPDECEWVVGNSQAKVIF